MADYFPGKATFFITHLFPVQLSPPPCFAHHPSRLDLQNASLGIKLNLNKKWIITTGISAGIKINAVLQLLSFNVDEEIMKKKR